VEYADGELPVADCARAESHLAACPGCSRKVAALRSSREMLSVYFATADTASPVAALRNRIKPQTGWNDAALALASMAATALLISLFFFLRQSEREIVRAVSPPTEVPIASTASELPEEDDVLAMISRETQIARLRMASEILAKEPGMTERHLALEKYLTQTYGVTTKRQPFEM
jgi:anti-sigma factor RsiW